MLELVILTSLKILAIHVCLQDGMILSGLRRWLERVVPWILQKPLFDCLTCMGGLWTVVFYLIDRPKCNVVELALCVIALNYLIAIWKDQFFTIYAAGNKG